MRISLPLWSPVSWSPVLWSLVLWLVAGAAHARPESAHARWVHDVRKATAHDQQTRACVLPRVIRYQSTLALLKRAQHNPATFESAAVVGWQLRLLELRREVGACLGEDNARSQRAELRVDVDLPPRADGDDWFAPGLLDDPASDGAIEADDRQPEGARWLFVPPDARPPLI